MSTYGNALYGGGVSGSSPTVGVPLGTGIIMPAYRIAGITQRAMITPNVDLMAEAIPELNRMVGGWNLDGHKIYTTSISEPLALVAEQKVYTIGPGGDFDVDRPVYIRGANVLFPTDPVVRRQIRILDDDEWRGISVQDIPGAPPYQLYYDGGYDDNGRGSIYLRFQPPAGYSLELYTWQSLSASFTDAADAVVLPPGHEDAIVYNLAARLAALNPGMAKMAPQSYQIAERSLRAITTANSRSPKMDTEPGLTRDVGPGYGWLTGAF